MRVLVTGGSGVLGRALLPRLGLHDVVAPGRTELDLLDAEAVARAVAGADAIYHLATSIPPPERMAEPEAWAANDRLRADASRLLVDAALAGAVEVYVQPSVAWAEDEPERLASALAAERETARFAAAGRRGVVLRLGLLDGPGTGLDAPDPRHGHTLHVDAAGEALAEALTRPSGTYVISRERGWPPS
jgi:2-alkyl-3-oxoalkanoate reductase